MKKLIFLSLVLSILSCEKKESQIVDQQAETITQTTTDVNDLKLYDKNEIEGILNDLSSQDRGPLGWIVEHIINFVQAHTGRQNSGLEPSCEGTGDCGACPALCLNGASGPIGGIINPTGEISEEDYEMGYRMYSLSLLTNVADESQALYFEMADDLEAFIDDGHFYVNTAATLSSDIAEELGKERITLSPGIYPVIYEGGVAKTVVQATFE